MIYKVVFDIDDLLCVTGLSSIHDVAFFKKYGMIIVAAQKAHYVFPGVKELMQATFNRTDVEVAFYSATDGPRNDEFVAELLKRSNVRPAYPVQVISKVFANKEEERRRDLDLYEGVNFARESKDLSLFVREALPIENVGLIDNGKSVSMPGQVKNQLFVETTSFNDMLQDDQEFWDEDGFSYLKGYVVTAFDNKPSIQIIKKEAGLQVSFTHSQSKERLTHLFEEPWAKELARSSHTKLHPKNTPSPLFNALETLGCNTREFPCTQNRMCYIAALLFASLDMATVKNMPLAEVFFEKQFIMRRGKWDRLCPLREDRETHLLGLSILRKVNKDYPFIHPHMLHARKNIPITEEERKEFQAYLDNQYVDCVVM